MKILIRCKDGVEQPCLINSESLERIKKNNSFIKIIVPTRSLMGKKEFSQIFPTQLN